MKKILSIDGGGIRGIIPGTILAALETKLQTKSANPQARLADYFDFFSGTSTGGILSCLLICPDENGRPRFSAQDAVDLYIKNGKSIFDRSLLHTITSGDGVFDEKYDSKAIETLLKRYFGNTRLSDLLKPCLISSYDITKRRGHFFCQHDAKLNGADYDFLVWDVCRSTSAAPTYFEANLASSAGGEKFPLVDGGVFVNNPAMCAYSEVRNAVDKPTAKHMLMLSLGTGGSNKPYAYEKARDWGMAQWVKPIIDVMMSGASETTDYYLSKIFDAADKPQQYIRLNAYDLGNASHEMDDASAKNIEALVEVGLKTAAEYDDILNKLADFVLTDQDSVVFNPDSLV